jgi:hypothetical protein
MNMRVNLIRESELRQPGRLNRVLVMRITVIGGIIVVILSVFFALSYIRNSRDALRHARARHKEIDPAYQDVRVLQEHLRSNRLLVEELKGWHAARVDWHKSLMDLRAIIPPSIQLTRLNVRGGLEMVHPPSWQKNAKPTPARNTKVRLDGLAVGEVADEVVVNFVRTLQSAPAFEPMMNYVKLLRLARMTTREGEEMKSVFGIEAVTNPRKMEEQKEPEKK